MAYWIPSIYQGRIITSGLNPLVFLYIVFWGAPVGDKGTFRQPSKEWNGFCAKLEKGR